MELVMPGLGLIFWMLIVFGLLLFLLTKFAWKPIVNSIKKREETIQNSLDAAENAQKEMLKLKAGNEELLKLAKIERDKLLSDAQKIKENIIDEAKEKANEESNRIIEAARNTIEMEKKAAIIDLKSQVAEISIDIAEKILKKELSEENKQKKLINDLLNEISTNN